MQRRFFEITELVEHLFGYSERSTLAAFASTCRALSELALDYLWGEYGNFDALMALLPDDIELEIADIDFDDPASPSLVSLYASPRSQYSLGILRVPRNSLGSWSLQTGSY